MGQCIELSIFLTFVFSDLSDEQNAVISFVARISPVTPDADDFDRFMTTMNNEITKVQNKIDNNNIFEKYTKNKKYFCILYIMNVIAK